VGDTVSPTDDAQDPLLDGITEALREQYGSAGVVVSYVTVARILEEDGSVVPWIKVMDGQDRPTTLGLLRAGQRREDDLMGQEWREAEDA
jgi:hypothetical protein